MHVKETSGDLRTRRIRVPLPFDGGSPTASRRIATAPGPGTTASGRILSAGRWPSHGRTSTTPPSRWPSSTRWRAVVVLLRRVFLVRWWPSTVIHVVVLLPVSLTVSVSTITIVVTVAIVARVLIVLLRRAGGILLRLLQCRSDSRRSRIWPPLAFVTPIVCHFIRGAPRVARPAAEMSAL